MRGLVIYSTDTGKATAGNKALHVKAELHNEIQRYYGPPSPRKRDRSDLSAFVALHKAQKKAH
jgi:hypothetical protein